MDEIGELGLDEQAMLLRAIEDKVFFPVGSDRESSSDFQLIAGTNRDLQLAVAEGRFRADLLARINLWSYALPGLAERPEDIAPNLDYEIAQCARSLHLNLTISKQARERFLRFAKAPEARWLGNFRDLGGAVRRMATLCSGGRISVSDVEEEIKRLRSAWQLPQGATGVDHGVLVEKYLGEKRAGLDLFEEAQLTEVLRVCEASRSMAHAGKQLFSVSRTQKKSSNDSDRIRKYLARFGLSWDEIHP